MASFNDIISTSKPVLVDFYAEWCGPCKLMTPVLHEVKDNLGDAVTVIKINVDKNPGLATRFQVRGVPTFMLFKDKKQVWRQSGIISKDELISRISESNQASCN